MRPGQPVRAGPQPAVRETSDQANTPSRRGARAPRAISLPPAETDRWPFTARRPGRLAFESGSDGDALISGRRRAPLATCIHFPGKGERAEMPS